MAHHNRYPRIRTDHAAMSHEVRRLQATVHHLIGHIELLKRRRPCDVQIRWPKGEWATLDSIGSMRRQILLRVEPVEIWIQEDGGTEWTFKAICDDAHLPVPPPDDSFSV